MKNFTRIINDAAHRLRHSVPLLLLSITMAISSTVQGQAKIKKEPPPPAAAAMPGNKPHQKLSYEIIPAAQSSFGYNIISGAKKLVHQPSVPGLPGNKGFTKKEDAEKCAQLVIKKINNNIMPPTVTRQELDSLKIKL
ncbi:hypothetical protein BH11BAC3_BH11BAC3_34740 [soil metagenome]